MKLLRLADEVLDGRPDLQAALRADPLAFLASPLPGLRPKQRRRARELAKRLHLALGVQPALWSLAGR